MARRFRLDYQTFQFVVLLGVPSLAVYAYGKYTQKSPEELEQHLKTNYSAEVMAARRNNNALKDMFAKRAESGAFDDETEERVVLAEASWRPDLRQAGSWLSGVATKARSAAESVKAAAAASMAASAGEGSTPRAADFSFLSFMRQQLAQDLPLVLLQLLVLHAVQ